MTKEEARLNRLRHCVNRRNKIKNLTIERIQMVYEDNIKKYGTLTCYLCERPIEFKKDCLEHISKHLLHDRFTKKIVRVSPTR